MDKRGGYTSLVVLILFFVLFVTFISFKSDSTKLTGYVTAEKLAVDDIPTNIYANQIVNGTIKLNIVANEKVYNDSIFRLKFESILDGSMPSSPSSLTADFIFNKTFSLEKKKDGNKYYFDKTGSYLFGLKNFSLSTDGAGYYGSLYLKLVYLLSDGTTVSDINLKTVTLLQSQNTNSQIINVTLFGYDSSQTDPYFYPIQTGDKIACILEYTGTGNVGMWIYAPGTSASNPTKVFENIIQDTDTNTTCDITINGNKACIAYYNTTTFVRGYWKCTAKIGNYYNQSNDLEMVGKAPALNRNIPNININKDGTYTNRTQIKLSDYFKELDGRTLTYASVGNRYITINIDSSGRVNFTNSQGYEGYEYILFRAYNGEIGTFSNNVTIKVGSGQTSLPQQCYSNWDCTAWGECNSGRQTRVCEDKNECGSNIGRPIETQTCTETLSLGAQTTQQIVIPKGNVAIEQSTLSGGTRTFVIILAVLGLLTTAGAGAYLWYKNKNPNTVTGGIISNKSQENNLQKQEQVNAANLEELKKYIETMLEQGASEEKIKIELIKVGWARTDIDKVFNYIKLKSFVNAKVKQGFDKNKIKESLLAKRWKQADVDSIFKELKL